MSAARRARPGGSVRSPVILAGTRRQCIRWAATAGRNNDTPATRYQRLRSQIRVTFHPATAAKQLAGRRLRHNMAIGRMQPRQTYHRRMICFSIGRNIQKIHSKSTRLQARDYFTAQLLVKKNVSFCHHKIIGFRDQAANQINQHRRVFCLRHPIDR
jgi:hypothetical protein